jgi:protein RecA
MAGNGKGRGNGSAESQKDKAIALAVSTIEKQFGKGAILTMTDDAIDREVQAFSSGSASLDLALGIGGYPRGRVVEIYGPESSGKTTLSLHAVAEVQRCGGVAAFVDAEHALDVGYARRLGVSVEDLLVSQPDTGEQALEIVDVLLRSGAIDLVVVDSVAALTPRAEIEGEMGDHHVGLHARLMSQALRKLTATVAKSHATVIFINQIRMKIGVMFGTRWRRPSGRPSSTSSTTVASRSRATSSTWGWTAASSRRVGPGTPTAKSASVRAARTRGASWPRISTCASSWRMPSTRPRA